MKKFFALSFFLAFSAALFAQVEVTKFLGIPVDGTKSEMISKLKDKGFVDVGAEGLLTGEFNGEKVYVSIVTNRGKVCRIGIADISTRNEAEIKIRFNNLCCQFEDNPKYISPQDYKLSEDEDISYNMMVNNKRYNAMFCQKSESGVDDASSVSNRLVWFMINHDVLGYRIMMFYDNEFNKANGEDL